MSEESKAKPYKPKEVLALEPCGSKEGSIAEPYKSKDGPTAEPSTLIEELAHEPHEVKRDSSPELSIGNFMLSELAEEIESKKSEDGGNIQSSKGASRESEELGSLETQMDEISDSVPEIGIIKFNPKSKKWSTSIDIPKDMRRYVIGAKGRKKRKIEELTDCRLIFPSRGKRMRLIMQKKAPYTHFVSLPMNDPDLQASFTKFAEIIQNDEELSDSCREPMLFQQPKKLHLTVVMLSLLDDDDMQLAAESLEQVISNQVRKTLDGKKLEVEVKGLQCMNDNPTKVRVLYVNAFSEKLDEIMNTIADAMGETELAPRRAKTVKIHLTLMNTRYCVHISSLMGPKDEDGYYSHIAKCEL
ncbi:unnamed protein product [Toxocara canis]|uniref:KH domain-containing protein n=1 Tax=Toxocara canis TaxID=6265 RepID=A0A183UNZ5_TOXCA|nr:unnamed protein product [Toxocara canis]